MTTVKFIKSAINSGIMARRIRRRITITDERELQRFDEIDWATWGSHIFYLDACALEYAVENHPHIVEDLLKDGNFRISHVAVKQLQRWDEPDRHDKKKHATWKEVQRVIKVIRAKWSHNIETIPPGDVFDELMMLAPLLSKTLTFNLVMQQFDAIYRVFDEAKRKRKPMNLDRFLGMLYHEYAKDIFARFLKECARLEAEKGIIIRNKEAWEETAVGNIATTLRKIMGRIEELVDRNLDKVTVKRRIVGEFENKVREDALIVQHYLVSSLANKHFPAHDKDTYELAMLQKELEYAA